jgi:hypothetical protein
MKGEDDMTTAVVPSKIQKRSQKAAWITVILTFIIPFGGYLYTSRYVLALISAVIWFGCLMNSNSTDPSDPLPGVVAIMMFVTAIENTIAVISAKKTWRVIEQEVTQHQKSQHQKAEDLRMQLLKLAQNREGVTIANCIIATGGAVDEIRGILPAILILKHLY